MIRPRTLLGLTILYGLALGQNDGSLKAVIVMFRHGDRTPLSSWPTDEYLGDSSLWPEGYGQLNNMGKERHYLLGQWFRQRYDGFLPAKYNSSDIYVRSTDVDRTLMSAAANLAGLYPPKGDQVWNENIYWQPIPIHTIPTEDDTLLDDAYDCPKHSRLLQQRKESLEFQQLNQQFEYVFENISAKVGYDAGSMTIDSFSSIFSALTIYKGYNLTVPDWAEYYWPEIQTMAALHFKEKTITQDMSRLRSGPFFHYLLDHLQLIKDQSDSEQTSKPPKFLMLSAHDTTIADRLNSMGLYQDSVPQFASTVIWEVKSYDNNNTDLYINLYFKNSTHFVPLTTPDCGFDCSLDNFATILEPIMTTHEGLLEECFE